MNRVRQEQRGKRPPRRRILSGQDEPILQALPQRVLDNLRRPASENALLWNLVYPLTWAKLSLPPLLALPVLWGTPALSSIDDPLVPFFWGYSVDGRRLEGLDRALSELDGDGPRTEVDLFLLGEENLVLVEAKNLGHFGRCPRFQRGRCPGTRGSNRGRQDHCRYWADGQARFSTHLDFPRPDPEALPPTCNRHYQLARTLVLGSLLASTARRQLHLWTVLPRSRWSALRPTWSDFAERVRDEQLWRRLRVLAWEDVRAVGEH